MGGVANMEQLPRVAPLTPAVGGRGMEPGRPPRVGVDGLTFTQDASGLRSMDYSYEGEAYYMRYTPSQTPNCYTYETRTVTNGGDIATGEYCR